MAGVDALFTLERGEDGATILRQHPGRWGETAEPLAVTLEDSEGGKAVTLQTMESEAGAESVILEALEEAGADGALRKHLVAVLGEAKIKDPAKTATRVLGKLHGTHRVKKDGDTHGMTYWLSDFAPPENP